MTVDPRVVRSRAAVLAAARDLLFEDGWDSVTHAAVSSRSGVGRTTIYRHWPDSISLISDVIAEYLAVSHFPVTDSVRDNLIGELDALRGGLAQPIFERAMRTIIERAPVNSTYRGLKETLYQEGSRGFRDILAAGIERGELDPRIDVDRAVDQLAGPVIYRRLLAALDISTEYVRAIVDDFLAAHANRAR